MRRLVYKGILCAMLSLLVSSLVSADEAPPLVRIVSPTNTTILAGSGSLQINVAVQPTGGVAWITFFAGTNRLGYDFTEPYIFTWTNPPGGRHALRALGIVTGGKEVESEPIHIQIGETFFDELTRGPYLQCGTAASMIVRWRTDWPTGTYVRYGTEFDEQGALVSDAKPKTEHEVMLGGLMADTIYYYTVLSERNILATGPMYRFRTAPRIGTARPIRIWAIGDSGTGDHRAMAVRDGYLGYADGQPPDVWLMLGDNAYESGTDVEYQIGVFEVYPSLLQGSVLWPTIGNHDAGPYDLPYLGIFNLPMNGEAGGIPSGTERYYSFDYANVHFICLDPVTSSSEPGSAMLTWLESDLIATAQQWIIAFWHYPPYSRGSYDSDSQIDLIRTRERLVPILERYGVDMVLAGHSHVYERSYLLDGHYGHSSSLGPEMILDGGSGRADEEGAYRKPAGALGDRQGCVYIVCGCSGEGGAPSVRGHPAMRCSLGGFGSMVIEVNGPHLRATFLRETSEIGDYFSIVKDAGADVEPRLHVARAGDKARLLWPAASGATLEGAHSFLPVALWSPITNAVRFIGHRNMTEVSLEETQKVFRLRR